MLDLNSEDIVIMKIFMQKLSKSRFLNCGELKKN